MCKIPFRPSRISRSVGTLCLAIHLRMDTWVVQWCFKYNTGKIRGWEGQAEFRTGEGKGDGIVSASVVGLPGLVKGRPFCSGQRRGSLWWRWRV